MIQFNVLAKINEKSYLSLMLKRFKDFIIENALFHLGEKILVAVSGGLDSVVLCHLLKAENYSFDIAHCNFKLRGEEAEQDEAFVLKLAEDLQVKVFTKSFDTVGYSNAQGISIQMAARDLRYFWFNELAISENYDWITTAHHANDLLETVLLNLTRGTGIAGFHGIVAKKGKLVRPMLCFTREQIAAYALQNKISYREDSSNNSIKYQRNLIRHQVVPQLKQLNPGLENTILQTAEKVAGVERFFIEKCGALGERSIRFNNDIIFIDLELLKSEKERASILFQWLTTYQFSWEDVKNILLSAEGISGKTFLSASHKLVVDRNQLVLTPLSIDAPWTIPLQQDATTLSLPFLAIETERHSAANFAFTRDPAKASFDMDKLKFPLVFRPWQPGDSFYPLGMNGQKKISDLLIDLKVPVNLKKRAIVLLSGDDIIWVVNYRMDDRFKIDPSTKAVFSITTLPLPKI